MTSRQKISLLLLFIVLLSRYFITPPTIDLSHAFASASISAPLGYTPLGQSLAALIIFGSTSTIALAITSISLVLLAALFLSLLFFIAGSIFQSALTRLLDALISIPGIFIALSIGYFLPAGFFTVVLALFLSEWPAIQKYQWQRLLELNRAEYILASHLAGASKVHIARRHLLRPMIRESLILFITNLPSITLSLAALEFMGVSTDSTYPSLGFQIAMYKDYLFINPLLSLSPILFLIFLIGLLVNLKVKR